MKPTENDSEELLLLLGELAAALAEIFAVLSE